MVRGAHSHCIHPASASMANPDSASASARKRSRFPPEEAAPAAKREPHAAAAASPAGFIFMCNGSTKAECYRHRVLGLPRGRLDAVSRIRRGAAVFLYDFDAKYLYGPYQADSAGGLRLVPAAFHGRFPAQVKFKIDGDFMPLPESSLKRAIKENYVNGRFSPELTAAQCPLLWVRLGGPEVNQALETGSSAEVYCVTTV